MRGLAIAVVAAVTTVVAGCRSWDGPVAPAAVIEPSYQFALGSAYKDVVGALGPPQRGPIHDRYSNTRELVYAFDRRLIRAESRMPDGVTRTEMVDHIHLFFDFDDILVKMSHRPNRFYSWFSTMTVDRITVVRRQARTVGW